MVLIIAQDAFWGVAYGDNIFVGKLGEFWVIMAARGFRLAAADAEMLGGEMELVLAGGKFRIAAFGDYQARSLGVRRDGGHSSSGADAGALFSLQQGF